ncbi:uncharacterized protein LOC117597186 [Pangasianodon hypophthalmus]|uniref:uncharacterized protein LOC117597186 n=1 Tax=Pangasianodon hypophthalmus TaxID=310915 RepID=UPI0023073D44|nr:uncharacterized protein LOC117597186 [Pangasianodon hypophthalmus]
MQHLCVLLWGLFVSCYCGSSDSFFVSQFPSTLMLRKEEQVQIICSWNISITRAKVNWFKDYHTVIFNQTDKLIATEPSGSNSTLVINNADKNDAGVYTCVVTQDIPHLLKVTGTGTNITYQAENEPVSTITPLSATSPKTEQPVTTTTEPVSTASPNTIWDAEEVYENGPVIFAIRCVPFITLLLAVWFLNRDKKNKRPRAGPERAEEQDVVVEEENERKGREQPGQERKEEERDKQLEQGRGVESENELTAEKRGVIERAEQAGQGREVEVVNELTGQERDLNKRSAELNECVE